MRRLSLGTEQPVPPVATASRNQSQRIERFTNKPPESRAFSPPFTGELRNRHLPGNGLVRGCPQRPGWVPPRTRGWNSAVHPRCRSGATPDGRDNFLRSRQPSRVGTGSNGVVNSETGVSPGRGSFAVVPSGQGGYHPGRWCGILRLATPCRTGTGQDSNRLWRFTPATRGFLAERRRNRPRLRASRLEAWTASTHPHRPPTGAARLAIADANRRRRCSTRSSPSTSSRSSNGPSNSATATASLVSSSANCVRSCAAGSSSGASFESTAAPAARMRSSLFRARHAASAPRVAAGGWPTLPPTSSTACSPTSRCGSGCSRSRSACATSSPSTASCVAASAASSSAPCSGG